MKKKIVMLLLSSATILAISSGCGRRPEAVMVNVPEVQSELLPPAPVEKTVSIYSYSEDFSTINITDIPGEDLNEISLFAELVNEDVIANDIFINEISIATKDGGRVLTIDLNSAAARFFGTISKKQQYAVAQCIANTYIDFFGVDKVSFSVNGKLANLEQTYYEKVDDFVNTYSDEIKADNTYNFDIATELFKEFSDEENNVALSPTVLNIQLLSLKDTAENKGIESFLSDVKVKEDYAKNFVALQNNNFSGLIMYDSFIANKEDTIKDTYLEKLNALNYSVFDVDFSKNSALATANNLVNARAFGRQANVFGAWQQQPSFYEIGMFDFVLNLGSDFLTSQKMFTNSDGEVKTVDYFTKTEVLPCIDTADYAGIIKDIEGSNYSVALISAKNYSNNFDSLDFKTLIDYYSIENKNVKYSIPNFSVESNTYYKNFLTKNDVDIFDDDTLLKGMFTEEDDSHSITDLIQVNFLTLEAGTTNEIKTLNYDTEINFGNPFVYIIFDKETKEVISEGKINKL